MKEQNHLCPNCQTLLIVPTEYWLKEMRCEECSQMFIPDKTNLQPVTANETAVDPLSQCDSAQFSEEVPENSASKNLYVCPDGKEIEGPIAAAQVMRRVMDGLLPEDVLITVKGEQDNWIPFSETPYFQAAYTVVTAERERFATELENVKTKVELRPDPVKKEGPDLYGVGCAVILFALAGWIFCQIPGCMNDIDRTLDDTVKDMKYELQRQKEADERKRTQRDDFLKSRNIR